MPIKCELVRIATKDKLELQGLLFEPKKKTECAVVHVHAWIGNFYENRFLDYIADAALSGDFAFMSFGNRGVGMVTDIIKRKGNKFDYARIGGCIENFEDCILDIKAAIDFLGKRGYNRIILEGHSLGTQKTVFYKYRTRDRRVKGLIELSPVDDTGYVKRRMGNSYKRALRIAKKMVSAGRAEEPVPDWMAFYPMLNARRFLDVSDPKSQSGRILAHSGKLTEIRNVKCPVLAVFGSKDCYEARPDDKLKHFKNIIPNCTTVSVKGAGHWFEGFESVLAQNIKTWLKKQCH